jgi:hypothetical protein
MGLVSDSQVSLAGAGGGGLVSMSQIVISDIVSLRERCVALCSGRRPSAHDESETQRKIPGNYFRRHVVRSRSKNLN